MAQLVDGEGNVKMGESAILKCTYYLTIFSDLREKETPSRSESLEPEAVGMEHGLALAM